MRKIPVGEEYFTVKKVVQEIVEEELAIPQSPQYETFKMSQLYGTDLGEKVQEYGEWVREIAYKMDFDVIHAHDWMTFLAGLELKAFHDKPLVLHVHSLTHDRQGPEARGWVYELERHAM